MGILSVALHPSDDTIYVGCGDGTIANLNIPKMNIIK